MWSCSLQFTVAVCLVGTIRAADYEKDGLKYDPNCAEKWKQLTPEHSMCLIEQPATPIEIPQDMKDLIIDRHNYLRAHVGDKDAGNVTASNMMKVYWDQDVADVAGMWAASCVWDHDSGAARSLPKYSTGQNGAKFSGHQTDLTHFWNGSINMWYNEVRDFVHGADNDLYKVGHFTQVVAALTARVGCGFAHCTDPSGKSKFTTGYCNYAYSYQSLKTPYKAGTRGADCPNSFDAASQLCDCQGKICYNGGKLNIDTCTCECLTDKWMSQPVCEMDCAAGKLNDVGYCNSYPTYCAYSSFKYRDCAMYCNTCNKCDGKRCQNDGTLDLATCNCICDASKCSGAMVVDTEAGDCRCKEACPGLNCNIGEVDIATCKCKCTYEAPWIKKDDCSMDCEAGKLKDVSHCNSYPTYCAYGYFKYRDCAMYCNTCNKCDGKRCQNGGTLDLATCNCMCDASKCSGGMVLDTDAGDCSCKEACPGLKCNVGEADPATCTCKCHYDKPWFNKDDCSLNCETSQLTYSYKDWCASYQGSCNAGWMKYNWCPGWCFVCDKCGKKTCEGQKLDMATCECV